MEYVAKCRLCGNEISFKDGNIYILGDHLTKHHPDTEMTHFFFEHASGDSESDGDNVDNTNSKSISKLIFDSIISLPNLCRPEVVKTTKTTNLFKTTVETWQPGSSPLTCPNCKHHDQPYIRKQKNKIARNSLGAFCLLGCWPLCFLPMVMCGNTTTSLCCRKCGYCFGIFDQNKGTLNPTTNEIKNSSKNNNTDDDKKENKLLLDLCCDCSCSLFPKKT